MRRKFQVDSTQTMATCCNMSDLYIIRTNLKSTHSNHQHKIRMLTGKKKSSQTSKSIPSTLEELESCQQKHNNNWKPFVNNQFICLGGSNKKCDDGDLSNITQIVYSDRSNSQIAMDTQLFAITEADTLQQAASTYTLALTSNHMNRFSQPSFNSSDK